MVEALAAILFIFAPAAVLILVRQVNLAEKLGPIVLCYAAGLLLGLSSVLPESINNVRTNITEVSLALALPLLLFSVDIRSWRHVAGRAMLSMFLAVVAVVFLATLLFYTFNANGIDHPEELSGLAVGMYTGGLANMGAIKLALGISDTRYIVFAAVDTFVGAFYLMFVLTIAPKIFGKLLRPFPKKYFQTAMATQETESYRELLRLTSVPAILIALIVAVICVGLALLIAPVLTFAEPQILIIVLLTSFGLLASFIPPIRNNPFAPKMGMYLIYVFSFCVASSIDLGTLAEVDLSILTFILIATFGTLLLHAILCRLFKVDVDTFLITSVAAILSPAFVPMVARSLGNPAILMSGMATGILGFAFGNYLGIALALSLTAGG